MKDRGPEKDLPFDPSGFPVKKQKVFMDDGRIFIKETIYQPTDTKFNNYVIDWVEIPSQIDPKPHREKNSRVYIGKYASWYYERCGCYVKVNQTCAHGSEDS